MLNRMLKQILKLYRDYSFYRSAEVGVYIVQIIPTGRDDAPVGHSRQESFREMHAYTEPNLVGHHLYLRGLTRTFSRAYLCL